MQCFSGLGRHLESLGERKKSAAFKFEYAANILFIASLGLAKASLTTTVVTLAPHKHKRINLGVLVLIALWAGSALLVVVFQCQPPLLWEYGAGKCINKVHYVFAETTFLSRANPSAVCLLGVFLCYQYHHRSPHHGSHA